MAKQSGIHQLKGKIRGMSYYRQKGVEDGLARSINQGLSKRVKEDVAYANTRLNAQEFGRAGSFAGAMIRSVSDRQRAMLKDFATGMLAKNVRDVIIADTDNPWGNRQLVGTTWQPFIMQLVNTYAKNDFSSLIGGVWDVTAETQGSDSVWTPNAELALGWGQSLVAKGATGVFIKMFACRVVLEDLGNNVMKGVSTVELIGEDDATVGTPITITTPATLDITMNATQNDNKLISVLVVALPYQEINGEKFIRQELCTFEFVEPTQG